MAKLIAHITMSGSLGSMSSSTTMMTLLVVSIPEAACKACLGLLGWAFVIRITHQFQPPPISGQQTSNTSGRLQLYLRKLYSIISRHVREMPLHSLGGKPTRIAVKIGSRR